MATSVYFNREALQGGIHFLQKYYLRECLNVKILKLFLRWRGVLISWREYLFISSYFPVNNYWGTLTNSYTGTFFITSELGGIPADITRRYFSYTYFIPDEKFPTL